MSGTKVESRKMPPAISSSWVCMGGSFPCRSDLEGEWIGEDAGAGKTAGHGPDEVDRVDFDPFPVGALGERAPGGPFEDQFERLTVDGRPLGDNVGDKAPVVLRRQLHRPGGGAADVDAVTPDVTGEANVEEVLEGLPADGRTEGDRNVAHRERGTPAALHRFRSDRRAL